MEEPPLSPPRHLRPLRTRRRLAAWWLVAALLVALVGAVTWGARTALWFLVYPVLVLGLFGLLGLLIGLAFRHF